MMGLGIRLGSAVEKDDRWLDLGFLISWVSIVIVDNQIFPKAYTIRKQKVYLLKHTLPPSLGGHRP